MIRILWATASAFAQNVGCATRHTSIWVYCWFCHLGLDGDVPDHSTFCKSSRAQFRESELLRKLFKTVVARCIKEKIVGREAFTVDVSVITADAYRRAASPKSRTSIRHSAERLPKIPFRPGGCRPSAGAAPPKGADVGLADRSCALLPR
jgi:hypothetical protein